MPKSRLSTISACKGDAEQSETYRLSTAPLGAGWAARFFHNGIDITNAITTAGWISPTLAVNSFVDIRVAGDTRRHHRPRHGAEYHGFGRLHAQLHHERHRPHGRQKTSTATSPMYGFVPLSIPRISATDIINTTARRTVRAHYRHRAGARSPISYASRTMPASSTAAVSLRRTALPTGHCASATLGTGADLTSAITGNGWTNTTIGSDATIGCYVDVTPSQRVHAGAKFTINFTAISTGDTTRKDVARAVVTATEFFQPDVWVRTQSEISYSGDNLYLPGAAQTKQQIVAAGAIVRYFFRIQNDGNTADSFLVTGTSAGNGWVVKYYDPDTNAERTAAITGSGWQTPTITPGASVGLFAILTPLTGRTGRRCPHATAHRTVYWRQRQDRCSQDHYQHTTHSS